jgi:hypothetical protein
VPGYLRVDQLPPKGLEAPEGPFLVGTDQPALPRDVLGENGGQPAFDRFQKAALPNRTRK